LSAFVHEMSVRVTYADTDKGGVVYYANYLKYFEMGRAEYVRSLGKSYADMEAEGALFTVSEASCRYRAPARYDELITIHTWVSRLRPTRINFRYRVTGPSGKTLVEGETVLACLDASGRPQPLPACLSEAIRERVVETPEA